MLNSDLVSRNEQIGARMNDVMAAKPFHEPVDDRGGTDQSTDVFRGVNRVHRGFRPVD